MQTDNLQEFKQRFLENLKVELENHQPEMVVNNQKEGKDNEK